jgi:hypothetical protein
MGDTDLLSVGIGSSQPTRGRLDGLCWRDDSIEWGYSESLCRRCLSELVETASVSLSGLARSCSHALIRSVVAMTKGVLGAATLVRR